jgi:hypothetical protein
MEKLFFIAVLLMVFTANKVICQLATISNDSFQEWNDIRLNPDSHVGQVISGWTVHISENDNGDLWGWLVFGYTDPAMSPPLEKCDGGRSKSVTPPVFHTPLGCMDVG